VAYAVTLVDATRTPGAHGLPQLAGAIQFGASPRASINLVAAARALAVLRGRRYALPSDVEYLAPEILRHRLVLTYESLAAGGTSDAAVRLLLSQHPAPRLDLADRDAA
jgi:MoxR-like ATPase